MNVPFHPCLLLLFAGCQEEGSLDANLSLAERVPTVVRLSWETNLDVTSAVVEWGPSVGYGHRQTLDPSKTECLLFGSPPESEVHARVLARTGQGDVASEDVSILTGPVPAALPNLQAEVLGADPWQGFLVTGLVADPVAVILDPDGQVVWWYDLDPDETESGVLYRVLLSQDRAAVLAAFGPVEGDPDSRLVRIGLDGVVVSSVAAPYLHHDFVELPDGDVAFLAYDPRTVDGVEVLGDRLMVVSPDGSAQEVWNIWDHPEFDPNQSLAPGESWPHANAIDYLPDEDAYLVGFLALSSVALVDRGSGEMVWMLGGEQSDFALPGGSTDLFDFQHQFEWVEPQHLLVFVNGTSSQTPASRAVEYNLDPGAGRVEEVWSYWPDPPLRSTNLGDVDRLGSGHTLVTFSLAGEIHEVDAQGGLVWRLEAGVGGAMGYVQRVDP